MMHKKRSEELKNVINKIGVDIKPQSMNIDWNDVKHSLVNLKNFVEKSKLMWGINNDYVFDDNFFNEVSIAFFFLLPNSSSLINYYACKT